MMNNHAKSFLILLAFFLVAFPSLGREASSEPANDPQEMAADQAIVEELITAILRVEEPIHDEPAVGEESSTGVCGQMSGNTVDSLGLPLAEVGERKSRRWSKDVLGVDEICFCSGTCTSWGGCLWGSCTGSLSCCLDCYQEGCDTFCSPGQQ